MSLEAIYSSKMFKCSSNQEGIKAQIENPINHELVQQLERYLDPDSLPDDKAGEDFEVEPEGASTESTTEQTDEGLEHSAAKRRPSPAHFTPSHIPHAPSSDVVEDVADADGSTSLDDSEGQDVEVEPDVQDVYEPTAPEEDADVTSATDVESEPSPEGSTEHIKAALNSVPDTSGVCRVSSKGNEVWIHYNDNINLNNVMESAIQVLSSGGYDYLEFNRLARSHNAIVFTIAQSDSASEQLEIDNA